MPTYAYRCPNGHEFDHFFRKMSDAVQTLPCPTCGEPGVRQVSGGAGLVFKGSGFYETDYKRAGKNGGEKSESKPAAEKPAAPAAPSGDGSKKSE
ncbi:MAG TPA: FmdB family zinc ribbon protein [Gemmatimonadaceae bacterium]|nr:FmdB family zinc ribbon protein [Gemmatimonadaceae bacterium]